MEPTGDAGTATGASIIEVGSKNGIVAQNSLIIVAFGTGANNTTGSFRVLGWTVIGNNPQTLLWVPINLCEIAVTLSAVTGVAGMEVVATERFADTMSITTGDTVSVTVDSPANDTIACAMVDIKGAQKIEISHSTGSSATDLNCLIRFI